MVNPTETITWHPASELPDADETVLLHMPEADEPVWPGYWDGEQWALSCGGPAPTVERWASMPTGGAS